MYIAVDLNSFICNHPFFATKQFAFANLSQTHVYLSRGSHVGTLAAVVLDNLFMALSIDNHILIVVVLAEQKCFGTAM
jgi:hypothetical protein